MRYRPCTSIKSQALASFVAKFNVEPVEEFLHNTHWELYGDGSSTKNHFRAGVVLISPDRHLFCKDLPFDFKTFNNEAKYEALIARVRIPKKLRIVCLVAYSDS